MRTCPSCHNPVNAKVMSDNKHYPDAIMSELYRRQKTSDLCLDCLLEEWAAEIGEARLRSRYLAYR